MKNAVTLPLWLAIPVIGLALWALLARILVPSVRWVVRRRINSLVDELNERLPIRVQSFKLTKRQVLIDRLMYDPDVLEAAAEFGREEGLPREVVMQKVERYAREIVPAFNAYFYFRLGYWLSRRLAQTLYRVRVRLTDEASLSAIDPHAAIVFVMNHRSNMDYVLVSYLVAERTALSYAVGEWARIWPLDSLIRATGAYFVRRSSRNALYRRVLQRYVQAAIKEGVTQAVYLEGGLSRDGLMAAPKLGLLDYMLRSFDPRTSRDIVFIPVGLNYDRVLEDRTLLLDLSSSENRTTGWRALWSSGRFLIHNLGLMARGKWHRFGYACVNFGTPISAKEYLSERDLDLKNMDRETRFERIGDLAAELMSAIGRVIPVLPVALVARVLLQHPDRPMSRLEFKGAVQTEIEALEEAGARVYVPRQDREYAIEVGLRMLTLRRAVDDRGGEIQVKPEEIALLEYYANSLDHFETG
ncbi:MAG: 1-acyl-sn-glycerol-3-phosphate acyltransferase [Thermoanaerobaculia bacterium]